MATVGETHTVPAADAGEAVFSRLFFTPEGRRDPYPLYQQLRELNPVYRSRRLGVWVLSRYDDCWAAMRDPRFGKDYAGQMQQILGPEWRQNRALVDGEHAMLNVGGPEHTRLRKLVSKSFTPRMVEALKPNIERTVNALLDPFAAAGGGDILSAVGFALPVSVIGEMLGVPAADRLQFHDLVRDLVAMLELQPTPQQLAGADAAQVAINDYFLGLLETKRRQPGDDLLSALATVVNDGDRLSDDEIVTLVTLLFAAGFEATTNVFGNGLLALLRHPEQLALLRRDPALFANLPDELLRYDGTAQLVNRVTETIVEIGGVSIPAGEQVFALLGAGNHDPARFVQPDQLDVTRTDVQPLTFGGGVHFCLGAALARAEIQITFRAVLGRFDRIALCGEPRFQDRLTLRGLERLEVEVAGGAGRPMATPAPVAPVDAVRPPEPKATRPAPGRGLRPRAGDADLRWRAELRQRIEQGPARGDSMPQRSGAKLAATVALLRRNSLFQPCTQGELERLAATAYQMSFEPGDLLCIEGAESPECYLIEEGRAVVTVGAKGVGTVGEHDVVGERGVLLDTVRAATVTALEHMVTYAISRQRLRALVDDNPAVRQWMLAEIQRRYPEVKS